MSALLEVRDLVKHFPIKKGVILQRQVGAVRAVDGVSLDIAEDHGTPHPQHYAFLVSEEEFDGIFARIQAQGIPYWADPGRSRPQQINHNDGGRGVYFTDPDGHFLEAITRPYGSGAA